MYLLLSIHVARSGPPQGALHLHWLLGNVSAIVRKGEVETVGLAVACETECCIVNSCNCLVTTLMCFDCLVHVYMVGCRVSGIESVVHVGVFK